MAVDLNGAELGSQTRKATQPTQVWSAGEDRSDRPLLIIDRQIGTFGFRPRGPTIQDCGNVARGPAVYIPARIFLLKLRQGEGLESRTGK